MILKIKKLDSGAILPRYAHAGDAGADLFSSVEVVIGAGEVRLIPTGIAIELPPFYEAQIRPRSGLALNSSITVLNTPGTIDSGYRGEIGVILINHATTPFTVLKGAKIAQMVIKAVVEVDIKEVDSLSESKRGAGGFGSTGG